MSRPRNPWRDTPENHPNLVLAEGGAWHDRELFERGWSVAKLAGARRSFGIVAWRDRFGGWHYPKWQFDANLQVLPHVIRIVRLLRTRDALRVISHFLTSCRGQPTCLDLIRTGRGARAFARVAAWVERERSEPELTPQQTRTIKRRLAELHDPARYVVVSAWYRGRALVYDVQQHVYGHNHVSEGAIIRDKKLAECVAKHLGEKRLNDLQVILVRKTARGYVALQDIQGGKGEKPWRPKFHAIDSPPRFVPIAPIGTPQWTTDAKLFAAENRGAIWRVVGDCENRDEAQARLVQKCGLSPEQADAILDMPLAAYSRAPVRGLKRELSSRRTAQ